MELICALCLALQAAINTGEVDRAAEFFSADAVVIQPRIGGMPQVYIGRDQIRWWLAGMSAQHAHLEALVEPHTGRFPAMLGVDAYRELGLDSVTVEVDLVLDDERVSSLTTILTPAAARSLVSSPTQDQAAASTARTQ